MIQIILVLIFLIALLCIVFKFIETKDVQDIALPISVKKDPRAKMILINLDKRKDRLDSVFKGYKNSDLYDSVDLYRLAAVNGRKNINEIRKLLSKEAEMEYLYYKKNGKRIGHQSLTEGGMGCYMSHVNAWKQVKKFGVPCIIAEDDINISGNTYERINDVLKTVETIPKNKPYVVLFHSICKSMSWDGLQCDYIDNGVYDAKQFWSMAFYYVTLEVASVLLNNAFPIECQVDHLLSNLNKRGLINVYYVNNVVDMAIYDTDIQAPVV
jgi:GR25 family glycosyltransferase involved in LPS biosynthesis